MEDARIEYRQIIDELQRLVDVAFALSANTQGEEVTVRGIEVGSWVFAKLCLHARAVVQLAPKGPLGGAAPAVEFWDISSMAVLTRAVVESYYRMFYLALDDVEDAVQEFRWLLWDYHSEIRRLQKLRLIGSSSGRIPELEKRVEGLKGSIQEHPVYLRQDAGIQKKLRNGSIGIFASDSDLSRRAQIDPAFYRTAYMFLSSYVHAYPFSMNQLAELRAGQEESLRLFSVVLRYCVVYLCLSLRDFLRLVPNKSNVLNSDIQELIKVWCDIAGGMHHS